MKAPVLRTTVQPQGAEDPSCALASHMLRSVRVSKVGRAANEEPPAGRIAAARRQRAPTLAARLLLWSSADVSRTSPSPSPPALR
jgi:hypothetical protein